VRLVTLTGAGGVGKTRVGLQVVADLQVVANLLADFADGVCFVPLAPVSGPALVTSAIAQALELRVSGRLPPQETLTDFLRNRQLLLLLDNFEQVLAAAPLVADLLAECARLKVLVTSRAALHVRGEREISVHPLACPDPQRALMETLMGCAALTLFVQRAADVKEGFSVSEEDAPAVVEICRRVDGLPLGIELAAARVRLLPPRRCWPVSNGVCRS
jgi:predicted ATPase